MITFLDDFFGSKMDEVESFYTNEEITYQDLQTLFLPGCEIIQQASFLDETQVLKFILGLYERCQHGEFYKINALLISHDGIGLGQCDVTLEIPNFKGSEVITKLPVFPLGFYPESTKIQQALILRRPTFLNLVGPVCIEYTGFGVVIQLEAGKWVKKRQYTIGRVIVDLVSFRAKSPDSKLLPLRAIKNIRAKDILGDAFLFCSHCVLDFSFSTKSQAAFAVSKLQYVTQDDSAVKKLIISKNRREFITSLIQGYRASNEKFDDIIPGKGKGLVRLLSGPPRTGKTLTAEIVAKLARRPLYAITASELGTEASYLDNTLDDITSTVRRQGCVLLINKADVFLQNAKRVKSNRMQQLAYS